MPAHRHRHVPLLAACMLAVGRASVTAQEPLDLRPAAAVAVADPRAPVGPGAAPHVPKAMSRPAGWPSDTKPPDNHVLSSIRSNPGAPLEPVQALIATEVAKAVANRGVPDGAVVQAAHEESDAVDPLTAAQSLEMALVVARVGPEVVLESDLLTTKALDHIEERKREYRAMTGRDVPAEDLRKLKLAICQQVLPQHVEMLLIYVDALREIPEDKIPEIRKNVDRAFDEQFLPKLMQEAAVANTIEYEHQLRAKGQSLDRMRKMFFERGIAQEWMRKNTKNDDEIAHAEMIAYYQNHLADYTIPAAARFEALTVKIRPGRTRKQAWDELAAMGNEVLAGKPLADVAKARSEGPTAARGGAFDWTTQGSLASKKLDEAIFSLPVGQLSAIIEDEALNLADQASLHIVRVQERKEAGRTPFLEAQVKIRQLLVEERQRRASDEYLAKLRERTPVWSLFDEGQAERQPALTAGRPTTTR